MTAPEDHRLEDNPSLTKKQVFTKVNFLALLIAAVMLLTSVVLLSIFVYFKLNQFTQTASISKADFYQTLASGWQQTPTATQGYKNLLILGVDTLETRGNSTPLTDSIILTSINLKTGQISLLPLPRDLWSEAYQTRINALYTYGLERYPDNPEQFSQEVISEMTNLEIHHTLVISMESVAEIIDLVGGVEINVEEGFIDPEFPRTDVDVTTETDPDNLYETVEFKTGLQKMDGSTALKYIRSRHGNNNQNTDDSRSLRQQTVIQSLAVRLLNKDILLNAQKSGQLYRYYLDNFNDDLPLTELIGVGRTLLPLRKLIRLESASLSIYPADPAGAIEHPPQYLYDGQWVYTIRDEELFKKTVQSKLMDN